MTWTRLPWLWIALPGVVAAVVFWRTLAGGFLSDDVQLGSLLDLEGGGADWSYALRDFTRPWFGVPGSPLYRPLLTLSFVVDAARGGGAAASYHASNLAFHVVATMATATVAAVLGARAGRAGLAALACGCFAAVHPAVVEPVAWIAARNSGIEVCFRNVALALFAVALVRPRRALRTGAVVAGACALLCKESAVVLPLATLAIDVLERPTRPLRERARLHAPFVALVAGYFLLRWIVLGRPLGSVGLPGVEVDVLGFAGYKLATLLVPQSGSIALGAWGIAAFVALWTVVLVGLVRLHPLAIAAAVLWPVALLAPTWSLELFFDFGGSRMLLGSVHALAVALAAVLFGPGRWPWLPRVGAALVLAAAVAMLQPTAAKIDRYERAWSALDVAMDQLPELGVPDRPVAALSMPFFDGIPSLNANAWFFLAQRPFQEHDLPFVELGSVSATGDASAVRAMWRWGAPLVVWDTERGALRRVPAREGDGVDLELRRRGGTATFEFVAPVHPFAFEVVEVRCEGEVGDDATVRLLTEPEWPAEFEARVRFELREVADRAGSAVADVTRPSAPLFMAVFPGGGFRVRGIVVEAGPGVDVQRVEVRERVEMLDVARRLDGAAVRIDELAARVEPPRGAAGRDVKLVLLGPYSGIALRVDEGRGRVEVTEAARRQLEFFASVSRDRRWWVYWQTVEGEAAQARSEVDWVVLE